jgi:hypothetical protein
MLGASTLVEAAALLPALTRDALGEIEELLVEAKAAAR